MDAKKSEESRSIERMKEAMGLFLPPECFQFSSFVEVSCPKGENEKVVDKMTDAERFLFSACHCLYRQRARLGESLPLDSQETKELEEAMARFKNLAGTLFNLLLTTISGRVGIDPEKIKICKGWEIVSEKPGQDGSDSIKTAAENTLETFKGLGIAKAVPFGGSPISSF